MYILPTLRNIKTYTTHKIIKTTFIKIIPMSLFYIVKKKGKLAKNIHLAWPFTTKSMTNFIRSLVFAYIILKKTMSKKMLTNV